MERERYRKALPVVRKEQHPNHTSLQRQLLPILHGTIASDSEDEGESKIEEKKETDAMDEPETMSPLEEKPFKKLHSNRLRLSDEDSGHTGMRARYSLGLDVPGAVHTIRTPSNVSFYLSLLLILLISLSC
jgi:hypothetical protein